MGGTDTPAPGVRLDAAEFRRRAEQLRAGWLADPDLTAVDVAALMQPYESFALMMAENEEEDRMGEEQPAGAAPSMGDDPLAAARARALAFDGLSPDELRAFADAIYDQGPLAEPAWSYRDIARGLLAEIDRLAAARARDRALLALLASVCTATYSGANEALLLMAKGRALDRLIAAWERLDADAARPPAGQGEETP